MPQQLRRRLTYANVVSSIALFIVLGGGAYATIDRKIGTRDLKRAAVTTQKIKPQATKAGRIADGAITISKLAGGVAITDLEIVTARNPGGNQLNSDSGKAAIAECPPGKRVLGGGGSVPLGGTTGNPPNLVSQVALHDIVIGETAVIAIATETTATPAGWNVEARAVCANVK